MKHTFISLLIAACLPMAASAQDWAPCGDNIKTEWADQVSPDNCLPEYPRPQMVRSEWQSLNGLWDYAVTPAVQAEAPEADGKILVPFAIESSLSGVGRRVSADEALWYRTTFTLPKNWKKKTVLLHFGAVDWSASVKVNGKEVGIHTGGFTAFSFDITPYLNKKGEQTLEVKVLDGTIKTHPRGKQTENPRGIWYTPVTGIWQTVWLEAVPETHIEGLQITSDIHEGTISVKADCAGLKAGDKVKVKILKGKKGYDPEKPACCKVAKAVVGSDGIAVAKIRKPHLWSADDPYLYGVKVSISRKWCTIDKVQSYTAMREVGEVTDANGNKRIAINGEAEFHFGPLDQGWWPDGLYTAPTDAALKYDIEMTKEFGFNMIRKHIKVEPARWFFYCDQLGIYVWQDMPSQFPLTNNVWAQDTNSYDTGTDAEFTDEQKANFRKEWKEIIDQVKFFPCVTVWVPFNEAWGQHDTKSVVEYTYDLDDTRLVNMSSGGNWVSGHVGDILDSHHYSEPAMRIVDPEMINVLGEYGGIGLPVEGHLWQKDRNWGYVEYKNSEEVTAKYVEYDKMLEQIAADGCSAAVYTQTTDVEGEINGLMTYDRKVIKLDIKAVSKANKAVIAAGK